MMRSLIVIALAQLLLFATAQAEVTMFTSDSMTVTFDANDLVPMQTRRGESSSLYRNYADYPLSNWALGRNTAHIQSLYDGTTFVTPPISVPPGATVSYQVDYALWFGLNARTTPTMYSHANPYFLQIYRETMTSCNASLAEIQISVPFRRVYASEVWAEKNPTLIRSIDRLVNFEQAILDKFKPIYKDDYANNVAMALKDTAVSESVQNTSGNFQCSRMRMVFPHALDVAVYGVTITIRN